MKKQNLGLLSFLLLGAIVVAAPTSFTNVLKDKEVINKVEFTTFKTVDPLFDGVADARADYAVSTTGDQSLALSLTRPTYIREMRIICDATAAPKKVVVRVTRNKIDWVLLDDVRQEKTADGGLVFIIRGENALAQYITIGLQAKDALIVREVELYPQMDIRLKERHVKDNWQVTDTEAFDDIDTHIDVFKTMVYSEVGAPEDRRFKLYPAPIIDNEMISVGGVLPGGAYEYKLSCTDFNGNILDLQPRRFTTRPQTMSFAKTTTGTFVYDVNGAKLPDTLFPITDSKTDLNTGAAFSGSIIAADQYVIIDLGQKRMVSEVVALWRGLGYSNDYSIQLSLDQEMWDTVCENQNAGSVNPARSAEGHPLRPVFSKLAIPKEARYVKLFVKKGSAYYSKHGDGVLELLEVKVF